MICKIGSYPCIVLVYEGHVELKIVFYKGTAELRSCESEMKGLIKPMNLLHTYLNSDKRKESSDLKTYLLMRWKGAWCFGCLSGPPDWISFAQVFSFIYCWVLIFAFLFFISWYICSRRWCIYKLGFFHANQISMCLDPHLNWRGWRRETGLSPPVKVFLLAVPRRCFFCGSYL